ncbi:hypothetical protein OROMI_015995 [Orobanche minor]
MMSQINVYAPDRVMDLSETCFRTNLKDSTDNMG